MINVLASVTEAELGALFVKCQIGAAMRTTITYMVHAQTTTPIVKDSATGDGFVNDNTQQRHSREINT